MRVPIREETGIALPLSTSLFSPAAAGIRVASLFLVASHSITHSSRLRFLARATPEQASPGVDPSPDHRPELLHQLAWDSLPYWRRRRLQWKQLVGLLTLSGAATALWLYWMSKLA